MWKYFSATALVFIAGQAMAQLSTYDCTIVEASSGGFMSDRLIVSVDTSAGKVRVIDGIINAYYEAPIDAEFVQRRNGNISWRWELRRADAKIKDAPNLNFTAILQPAQKTIQLSGLVLGFDNDVRGHGSCETTTRHLF